MEKHLEIPQVHQLQGLQVIVHYINLGKQILNSTAHIIHIPKQTAVV